MRKGLTGAIVALLAALLWFAPLNFWSGPFAETVVDGTQDVGFRGARWLAAAAMLSTTERHELAQLTPHVGWYGSGDHFNGSVTSSWNPRELRWEEDFFGAPGKRGKMGPRAILPIEAARDTALTRWYGAAPRVPIAELRTRPGYRYCPKTAGPGVFDIYFVTAAAPGIAIRGWIGSFIEWEPRSDTINSLALIGVPEHGFRGDGGGYSPPPDIHVVPHDMAEPWNPADKAYRSHLDAAEISGSSPPPGTREAASETRP